MTDNIMEKRAFRVTLTLIALLVIVLIIRSERTVDAVLSYQVDNSVEAEEHQVESVLDMSAVAYRDSLLVATELPARNPFKKIVIKPKRYKRRVSRPPQVVTPELSALLFDNVNPMVQISIKGERSGWLHKEDEFMGWRVTLITKSSVEVCNKERSVVLQ